ncbi:MAG TPA: CHAP domain-containing protein [Solirubrobacteraceae bacterium]|nr:CHAP domain-containing protein [Solirubrobacteraceae bacterium]
MSLEATLERVSAIRQALADPASLIGASTGGTPAPSESGSALARGGSSFAAELERASGDYEGSGPSAATAAGAALEDPEDASYAGLSGASALSGLDGVSGVAALSPTGLATQDTPGARIVAIAESQIGQTEQPPGSNESPAIAQYRTATAGAIPGAPWCAYFASWVARQAGEPIGEGGQGAGAVSEVWSWAQSTGRAIPNGPGVVPKPGDLIVFGDEHVGIVRDVLPDGDIQTIEGNYENKVAANVRTPTEATGYVEMS